MTPKQHLPEMGISARQLPVRLAPCADELLSSWITRHAAFYAIPPLAMLQHCLPEMLSLRTADLDLTEDQVVRIALTFSIEPTTVRRMTFSNIPQSSRRMIARSLDNHAAAATEQPTGCPSSFEANISAGGSLARFAEAFSRQLVGVTAPLPSAAITMQRG